MSVVIIATNKKGKRRRCDARCHNALGEKCECVCEGRNHGLGLQHALDKTHNWVIEMMEMANPGWHYWRPQHQRELFKDTKGGHAVGDPSEAASVPTE